ncbi:MAG: phosphoribosylanthranilate isomerase [Archaeoglobaceae archaeon]
MFVKVCGIRSVEELEVVEKYADATGVVVECSSRRRVSLEKAREIVGCASIPVFVVSTLESFDAWLKVVESTGAEFVQLHGNESTEVAERLKEMGIVIMKAFRVPKRSKDPGGDAAKLLETIRKFDVDLVLLDTGSGSGELHDLRVSRMIAEKVEIVLAGGLNPENVREVVEFVKPFGVDVSSGVEKGGRKSAELVRAFAAALGKI